MSEKRMMRRIFGPKTDEGTEERRKLHKEELCVLYSARNISPVIKSRRLKRPGHIAHMGESRGAFRVLV